MRSKHDLAALAFGPGPGQELPPPIAPEPPASLQAMSRNELREAAFGGTPPAGTPQSEAAIEPPPVAAADDRKRQQAEPAALPQGGGVGALLQEMQRRLELPPETLPQSALLARQFAQLPGDQRQAISERLAGQDYGDPRYLQNVGETYGRRLIHSALQARLNDLQRLEPDAGPDDLLRRLLETSNGAE